MRRVPRYYFAHSRKKLPVYTLDDNSTETDQLDKALTNGAAKIVREYTELNMFGDDKITTVISWQGREFAVVQRVRSEQSI